MRLAGEESDGSLLIEALNEEGVWVLLEDLLRDKLEAAQGLYS